MPNTKLPKQQRHFELSVFKTGFATGIKPYGDSLKTMMQKATNFVIDYVAKTPAPTNASSWDSAADFMREQLVGVVGYSKSRAYDIVRDATAQWGDRPSANPYERKRKQLQRTKAKAKKAEAKQAAHDADPASFIDSFWAAIARSIDNALTLHSFSAKDAKDVMAIKRIAQSHLTTEDAE